MRQVESTFLRALAIRRACYVARWRRSEQAAELTMAQRVTVERLLAEGHLAAGREGR